LVASVLQEAGYKTGLYTSPHLKDFRERIRINAKKIDRELVTQFVVSNKEKLSLIQPSFFEYTFGMAMDHFNRENVDIAIIETGMGGRLDSTSVITPEISVITNIGYDHIQFLGNTLEKIAVEKAGIIKPNIPVIVGEMQSGIKDIFIETAKCRGTDILFADQEYYANSIKLDDDLEINLVFDVFREDKLFLSKIECPLTGIYQKKNLLTAIAGLDTLASGSFNLSEKHIHDGVKNVIKNTGILGRWQVLNNIPLTICDTGHNKEGLQALISQINSISFERLHFVYGTVADKNIDEILAILPKEATYYFCKPDIPRGLDADELKVQAKSTGLKGNSYPSVASAFEAAKENANSEDLIFIGGSTFVVAEVI